MMMGNCLKSTSIAKNFLDVLIKIWRFIAKIAPNRYKSFSDTRRQKLSSRDSSRSLFHSSVLHLRLCIANLSLICIWIILHLSSYVLANAAIESKLCLVLSCVDVYLSRARCKFTPTVSRSSYQRGEFTPAPTPDWM